VTTATGTNMWQLHVKTLGEAARKICEPHGIEVVTPDGDAPFPAASPSQAFNIYPGYTGYALLEEMARAVGMLLWDDEKGRLVISKGATGGRAASAIIEGQNAEVVEANLTADQRFARYMVVGQGPSDINGHINAIGEIAKDPEAAKLRHRTRIIPFELPGLDEYQTKRAQWEANRRYGRSLLVRVTVTGWRDGAGKLWKPNTLVSVDLPAAKIKGDRVIAEAVWQRGEQGTQTILTLMPPKALDVQPFAAILPVPLTR
jgi:prophage tail gpP-like protein